MSVGIVDKQTGDRIPTAGMPAIDNALSATSTNPVQNAIITAALANKQNAIDNSLQTTDKTIVGGINELKSGLTNVDARLDAVESKIKTDTFSGTTDAYGNINLNNYRYVLTAYAGGYICIPFEYNYNRYIKVLSTTTFEPVVNTNISGAYTYLDS
jgi:hypothetical protein